MKALVCEMCGSQDLIKQDGMYVCQSCGTKYDPEEAKKLMVEVSGSVKVDNSAKLQNYYQLARRAANDNNASDAAKYYDLIRQEEPNSWEAYFYSVYFEAMNTTIGNITSAANKVTNCVGTVLNMIDQTVTDPDIKFQAVGDVAGRCQSLASMMYRAALDHYNGISDESRKYYYKDLIERGCATRDMLLYCGNLIEQKFGEKYAKSLSSIIWQTAIDFQRSMFGMREFRTEENKKIIDNYAKRIQKYDPTYKAPEVQTGGCYVATAVYGSYDCPEVWTLRRYRDYTLAETWYGRMFISLYYTISPTLVKWFGETKWFKKMWKPKLDKMVMRLNREGVLNTPYNDKNW